MKYKKMSPGLILVDSALIKWALHESNEFANELALHSILRATHRNGVIRFREGRGKQLSTLLGVTAPTAKKRFTRLVTMKWIVVNSKSKIYRLISTKVLLKRYGLVMSQAALMKVSDLKGKNPVGPFLGAFIGFQNKMQSGQKRTQTVGRKLNDNKGLALPVNGHTNGKGTSSALYSKCTDKRLSRNLGWSEKKAQRDKRKAKERKAIQIEPMARADPGFLHPSEMGLYLKYCDGGDQNFLGKVERPSGTFMFLRAASKVTSFVPVLARRWIGKGKKVSIENNR